MCQEITTLLTTYALIALCELGDKTQVAVLLMSSNSPGRRWLIFLASVLALTVCVVIEVTAGVCLAKHIGPSAFNRITGIIFLIVGGLNLMQYAKTRLKPCSRHLEEGQKALETKTGKASRFPVTSPPISRENKA